MGHRLLGELPRTQNWVKVIDLLGVTDDPATIADATSRAADHGLDLAKKDTGVAKVAHMLMKLVWSARGENFEDELAGLGMSLPKDASLLDVVGTFDKALDRGLYELGHRSDLAEMARFSAVDALTEICQRETGSLFGVSEDDARQALGKYATATRFGAVGQDFFGKFLYRFLDYHLSRELPNHVGPGRQFASIHACNDFKDALVLHCHQTARIVKEFAGCWPSATEFQEGITVENVRTKFIPTALKKISSELKVREKPNE